MAAWSSELQVHRIAFPLWVFAFTLGFPTIFPTNAPNLRKTSRYILKRINTRRSPNPLQHRGLGDLTWHEWVRRKSSHGFLVRMRSAVRIRPAAPKVLFSRENRTFSLLFCQFNLWVTVWDSFDPHRDPHAEMRRKGERAQERKFSFLSRAFIAFGVYITCAMKLPMACAASSCFCRVAWV